MECLAWDYSEMPELARDLIEHRLPIKKGFKPYKQPQRRVSPELMPQIKEEIEKLLKVGFIRPWLDNIVPVTKKNGKIRICIDFRDLNLATPKDEYVMPIADMLIDLAAGSPGALGIYKWTVMPFGLKNVGATYQRAMNTIFHDLIGQSMEVYIDDVIIKSTDFDTHLVDLKNAFIRMKQYNLKMNPTKCAFGVSAGNFLGLLVHEKGIDIDANKAKAVLTMRPPRSVKKVQSLLGKGRLMKWAIKLAPFALRHRPIKAVKGQVVADLLVEFAGDESLENKVVPYICTSPWKMFFDGSHSKGKSGAGVILEGPGASKISLQLQMEEMTHNSAEYEALILDLEAFIAKGVQSVLICGDSQLVINQVLKRVPGMPESWSIKSSANSRTENDEAVPLKNATQKEVIEFVLNYIVHRFGIPHTLTTDQGLMFTGEKFVEFLAEFNIKLHHSSPYYPQANGLAEAANKIVIGIIRKMVEENPRKWHTLLSQALWAHRNSRNTSTGFSPYQLTFGQDAVLPAEFVVPSPRVTNTTACIDEAYAQRMWQQLEEVDTDRLNALDQVVRHSEIRASTMEKEYSLRFLQKGIWSGRRFCRPIRRWIN
ncbi:uncharacterized protein LOC127265996 [Andrographis paniculata]|uniref:uncharacterized protein LOC127265996 n=1 Tax=Andrographis paniculata TaxID=175694 RepID=UPI0021E8D3C8|nr:uncharacterized protein LOC127265996 [Andrographis paniculata]